MEIKAIIKEQEEFVTQVVLTLLFLKAYDGNPESFDLFLSQKVKDAYEFDKYKTCPDYLWETLDEITTEIVHGPKKFVVKQNGLFPTLEFATTKKRTSTVEEILDAFARYTNGVREI